MERVKERALWKDVLPAMAFATVVGGGLALATKATDWGVLTNLALGSVLMCAYAVVAIRLTSPRRSDGSSGAGRSGFVSRL